ncbi:hypothetical protein MANES_17G014150v8 [Manihot esculenta]|uniref:Uncharacterized protein n=2 Tax=Manihot esculenta TaxID=3983 RepID=A0ACB7G1J4_MANES|nr:hypothetical protein MANES_17G014150v8 [Manihot esculenta]
MSFLRSVPALLRRFLCSSLVVRCCSSPRPRSLQLEEMMWASVRRKVLSGSSTTYLVLEQSLPGTCFMAPLSRSYSNPLKILPFERQSNNLRNVSFHGSLGKSIVNGIMGFAYLI